jgi:inhibitor of KinA
MLLQGPLDVAVEKVHESSRHIQRILSVELVDLVPSYTSIALFHNGNEQQLIDKLLSAKNIDQNAVDTQETIKIPICYELGLDLEEVAKHSKKSVEEVIKIHQNGSYKAIFIGFTPGFIYMDGLDRGLSCPRKSNPRKYLEPGSVGIGGEQTGIYSLASPGGWNIIGRTPLQLFDSNLHPPMRIPIGSDVTYYPISLKEFESWEN